MLVKPDDLLLNEPLSTFARAANLRAAQAIFAERNAATADGENKSIDLHYLHVGEALDVVKTTLDIYYRVLKQWAIESGTHH